MKLNGIFCTNYSAGERFSAELQNTTADEIKAITPNKLTIQTDDGSAIEEFTAYGRLFSVKHIISEDRFEVVFEKVSDTEKKLSEMDAFIEGIKEVLSDGQ